ncbi:phage portal protein [Anaerobacillus sp. HL2]|nr:phage portal protein [Anaerobacillus sp. HL2]
MGAFERNVVGTGFKLQAKTDDEELNAEIEKLWKEWSKPRNCDVTFKQSFSEIW